MEALSESWRTSSYSSGNGGNCVEVGTAPGSVAVRDTTNRDGAVLTVAPAAWAAFAARVKSGTAV
jgi:hypothetical protein